MQDDGRISGNFAIALPRHPQFRRDISSLTIRYKTRRVLCRQGLEGAPQTLSDAAGYRHHCGGGAYFHSVSQNSDIVTSTFEEQRNGVLHHGRHLTFGIIRQRSLKE